MGLIDNWIKQATIKSTSQRVLKEIFNEIPSSIIFAREKNIDLSFIEFLQFIATAKYKFPDETIEEFFSNIPNESKEDGNIIAIALGWVVWHQVSYELQYDPTIGTKEDMDCVWNQVLQFIYKAGKSALDLKLQRSTQEMISKRNKKSIQNDVLNRKSEESTLQSKEFSRAIELEPKSASAYLCRGLAYSKLGDNKRAVEDYNRAIEIDPAFAEAYYNRGLICGNWGDNKRAVENWKTAARLGHVDAQKKLNENGNL